MQLTRRVTLSRNLHGSVSLSFRTGWHANANRLMESHFVRAIFTNFAVINNERKFNGPRSKNLENFSVKADGRNPWRAFHSRAECPENKNNFGSEKSNLALNLELHRISIGSSFQVLFPTNFSNVFFFLLLLGKDLVFTEGGLRQRITCPHQPDCASFFFSVSSPTNYFWMQLARRRGIFKPYPVPACIRVS